MNSTHIPFSLRQSVTERARNQCEYCQSPALYSPEIFEIEHVQPRAVGGITELSNLALSCPACNRFKGTYQTVPDPDTGKMISLFNPRTHYWPDHFTWSEDFTSIIGLTSVGKITIVTLKMNRLAVQRFRIALQAIGQHPAQH